jgi:hypothetical protein
MVTQTQPKLQPVNPANSATADGSVNPDNSGDSADHLAWLPAAYLCALVPFSQAQGDQIQIPAIHFDGYASFGLHAPYPDRSDSLYEHLDDPYCGQYIDSGLALSFEFRMRQAHELQGRLAADASELMMATTDPYPSQVHRLDFEQLAGRRQLIEKKRDALVSHQKLQLSRLHQLVELTQVLFERLRLTEPSDQSTTPFAPESVALMKKAGIELPEVMNPLGLYQSISRRLLVQEQEVAAVGLDILRDEIQLARMGLYAETGQFLRAQAQTVMALYLLPENALLIDTEDEIYQDLQMVVVNPIHTRWPSPEQPEIESTSDYL